MTDRAPIEVTNLDIYGNPPLEWSRVHDLLAAGPPQPDIPGGDFFTVLGTVRPDGQPHAAAVGAIWHDGDFYLVSGPGTRKSRNLAANPAFTLTIRLTGMDLVVEGEATRVTDWTTLEELAARYRAWGWPTNVADEAFTAPYSAPSAGPPPWYLYRLTYHTAFGVAGAEPPGATRWRFAR
jgi:hypothetical protein